MFEGGPITKEEQEAGRKLEQKVLAARKAGEPFWAAALTTSESDRIRTTAFFVAIDELARTQALLAHVTKEMERAAKALEELERLEEERAAGAF